MTAWNKAQEFEKEWHNKVSANTFHEEEKQFVYAEKMGLEFYKNPYTPYNLKNYGKVLDIGGGENSLLLKAEEPRDCVVLDPCDYPQWVTDRYKWKGIDFIQGKAEEMSLEGFDSCWLYNVLQHTEDPEKVCYNAKKAGKLIRIFEWIETPTNIGHIHTLTKKDLDKWLGGYGKTEMLNGRGCYGLSFYGVFNGI
jgi:2-polyprenyl-3-methyl-5-hydroxy-6-metoxy-1,4-benzoquinol methylase